MNKSIDVYIVNTPRQWWIANAIAYRNNAPCVLLVENGFQDAELFASLSQEWPESPFEKVILLFGKNNWQSIKSKFRKEWLKKTEKNRRYKELKSLLNTYRLNRLYTSNVSAWNVQYLLHLSKGRNVYCSYMDDGTLSYYEQKNYKVPFLKYMQRKLHYGWWYKKPCLLGEAPWVDCAYVFSSKHVNSHLKVVELINLDDSFFKNEGMETLAKALLSRMGLDLEDWKNNKKIFVFSRIGVLEKRCPGYAKTVKKLLIEWSGSGSDIWVKYHPREVDLDPLSLREISEKIKFLPAGLPFEVLSMGINVGDEVSGDISTVLMDVKLQNSEIEVESYICKNAFLELIDFYKSIGIKVHYI